MAEKRDYYEVLGVEKGATKKILKRPIVNWQWNIILMLAKTLKQVKI